MDFNRRECWSSLKESLPYFVLLVVATVTATFWRRALGGDTVGYAYYGEIARKGFLLATDNYYFAYPVLLRLQWFLGMEKTLFSLHLLPWLAAIVGPLFLMLAVVSLTDRRWIGCFAGLVAVLFPLQVFVVNVPLTEPLFLCGLSFCLWMMVAGRRRSVLLLTLLPVQAALILVRYDAILLAPFLLAYAWIAARRAGVGAVRRVVMGTASGLVALLLLAPMVISNMVRNAQAEREYVDKQTYNRILAEIPDVWEAQVSDAVDGEANVDLRPVRAWYDREFPDVALGMIDAIRLAERRKQGDATRVVVPMRQALPIEKVVGWGRVIVLQLAKGPGAWIEWVGKVWGQAVSVLPAGALLALCVVCAAYGGLVLSGVLSGWRRRDMVVLTLALYTLVYVLVALLMIRGNVSRHMARIVPAAALLMAAGLDRLIARDAPLRRRWWAIVAGALLFAGSCTVTGAYIAGRQDQAWVSLPQIIKTPIRWDSLYDKSSLFCRNLYLEEKLARLDRRRLVEWPEKPDSEVWVDFMRTSLPPGVAMEGWTLERPPLAGKGAFGIYQGSWPVECTFVFAAPWPVKKVMLSTFLYSGTRKPDGSADELFVDISFDGGESWVPVSLPEGEWRDTPCTASVNRVGAAASTEVRVRLRMQVCSLFSLSRPECKFQFFGEEIDYGYSRITLRSHLAVGMIRNDGN